MHQKILQNPQGLNLTGLDTDLFLHSFLFFDTYICCLLSIYYSSQYYQCCLLLKFSYAEASENKSRENSLEPMAGWVFAKERSAAEWFAKSPGKPLP
jgi:hypothetical protein